MKKVMLKIVALLLGMSMTLAITAKEEQQRDLEYFVGSWQESNSPVVLIKEIPLDCTTPRDVPSFTREGMMDEPSRLIVGEVVLSTTQEIKLETIVLLERAKLKQENYGYKETPFWIIYMGKEDYSNVIRKLNKDGTILYVLEVFTLVRNGNVLKRRPDLLHGVWKQMYNMVIEKP